MLHFIDVFRRVYCRVSYILSAAIIVFMTCLQFFQIFYRYVCGHVFIFSITTAVAVTIPPLWLEHGHVTMDLITGKLSRRADHLLSIAVELISFAMSAAMAYAGIVAVRMHIGYSTSLLGYDDSLHYLFVVYIGVMLCVTILLSLIERILKYHKVLSSCHSKRILKYHKEA